MHRQPKIRRVAPDSICDARRHLIIGPPFIHGQLQCPLFLAHPLRVLWRQLVQMHHHTVLYVLEELLDTQQWLVFCVGGECPALIQERTLRYLRQRQRLEHDDVPRLELGILERASLSDRLETDGSLKFDLRMRKRVRKSY